MKWVKKFFKPRSVYRMAALGIGITLSAYLIKRHSGPALEYFCWKVGYFASNYHKRHRPHLLILVRTTESLANIDNAVYASVPDNKIGLTEKGISQADNIGKKLREYIDKNDDVSFFVSPFERARVTAREIIKYFPTYRYFEDPRLRAQEWGNLAYFQCDEVKRKEVYAERTKVGRFFYRFQSGESGADVYDRISLFFETLYRQMDLQTNEINKKRTFLIVGHGTLLKLILMRYERMSIEDFHKMKNIGNGEAIILKRFPDGRYKVTEHIFPDGTEENSNPALADSTLSIIKNDISCLHKPSSPL